MPLYLCENYIIFILGLSFLSSLPTGQGHWKLYHTLLGLSFLSSLPTGQGHTAFLLTLTSVLWMLGGCQLNSDLADNPSGLQAAPAEFSTPPLQTTFAADSILSSKTVTPTPVDSAADLHSSGSSPEKRSDGQDGSIFVSPRVTITPSTTYSENLASSFASDLQFSSSFSRVSETVDSLEVTPVVSENPSLGLVIESTHFLDSVAASLRWNPAEGVSESTLGVRHVQSSIPPDTGAGAPNTGTPAPDEHSSSTPVLVAPTTTWFLSDTLSPSVTEDHASWSGEDHLETFASSASLPVFSPVSEMFNTTQPSTSIQSVAAETTSPIWSSTPGVSSPVPAGGNTSCAEKDTGCVEYRGEEDSREEEVRIKVIVGGACGAILLVVVLGELEKAPQITQWWVWGFFSDVTVQLTTAWF